MSPCPQPKTCACGDALPVREAGRGGRNRKHCERCRPAARRAIVQRSRKGPSCPHCPHCQQAEANAALLEEVAQRLEAQEWRAAAAEVRALARRNPPEEARAAAE